MQKRKVLIRLLTLITYFLPFVFLHVSCDKNFTIRYAYSSEQAEKFEKEIRLNEPIIDTVIATDTVKEPEQTKDSLITENTFTNRIDTNVSTRSFQQYIEDMLVYLSTPTENSVSAIGCIYLYDAFSFGSLFIAGSLLLLLFNLILVKWVQRKKIELRLDIINLILLISFLIQGFIFDMDLLWGFWLLFIIQVLYVFFGFREKYKTKTNMD